MVKRNETRKIFVGDVQIGGQDKVIIQSMVGILSKIFLLYKQSFSSEMICFYG